MDKHLRILWTSDNPVTVEKMILMYAGASLKNGWWDDVTVIIWGASAALAVENDVVRAKIAEVQDRGVRFSACRACAEQLGVAEDLEAMGVEVIYWGEPLTEILRSDTALLTV